MSAVGPVAELEDRPRRHWCNWFPIGDLRGRYRATREHTSTGLSAHTGRNGLDGPQPHASEHETQGWVQDWVDRWIVPELRRRREAGLIPEGQHPLSKVQVIFEPDGTHKVRINEEVLLVVRGDFQPGRELSVGGELYLDDLDVTDQSLTDQDPDAAHVSLFFMREGWLILADHRYNATTAQTRLGSAPEFLDTAREAMAADSLHVAGDVLFSGVELCAQTVLLLTNTVRDKHPGVKAQFNRLHSDGLVPADHKDLLREAHDLRLKARYRPDEPLDPGYIGGGLFDRAEAMWTQLYEVAPKRVALDEQTRAAKGLPPRS